MDDPTGERKKSWIELSREHSYGDSRKVRKTRTPRGIIDRGTIIQSRWEDEFNDKVRGRLAMPSYFDYLMSSHWKEFNEEYRRSTQPQRCIVCDDPEFTLFHRTYSRIGNEDIMDVIPLCGRCHEIVKTHLDRCNTRIQEIHSVLRQIFGWGEAKALRKFGPFSLNPGGGFQFSRKKVGPENRREDGRKR